MVAPDRLRMRPARAGDLFDAELREETAQAVVEVAPSLEDTVRAVLEPALAVRCVAALRDRVGEHRVLARPGVAAVLATGRDEEHGEEVELSAMHPTAVPVLLAGLVGLGPHRSDRAAEPARPDVVADLLAPDDLLRSSALRSLDAGWAWTIEVLDAGRGEGDESQTLSGIDGPRGLALLGTGDSGEPRWEPSSSTEVFRMLTSVLR